MKLNSRIVGDAGEYLVAYNLSRRGLAVALMNRGAKGVDMLVTNNGKDVVSIQVKSSQGRSQPRQWMVGKHQPSPSSHFFYVFCNIWEDEKRDPEIFVVPSKKVSVSVDWNANVPLFKIITIEEEKQYLYAWEEITTLFDIDI